MPGGLFERVELDEHSIYNKIFLPYTVALGTVFSKKQKRSSQEQKRSSLSFEREYNLKYLGGIGNLIPIQDIESAIEEYDLGDEVTTSPYFTRWCGIDPGYSSSLFGIVVMQLNNDKLECVYTAELNKPLYTDTLHLIRKLVSKFHLCHVYIDMSASHLIHELKHGYDEYISYEKLSPEVLERQISSACGEPLIIPINFQKMHRLMAKHAVKALAHKRVRIHPKFEDLINSLKSVTTRDDQYSIDKSKSAHNDLFDAFRLSLLALKAEGGGE
jgi:hypothetical protein